MKIETKITFDNESEIKIIKAVHKLMGKMSQDDKIKHGLTGEESDECGRFYYLLDGVINNG